MSDFTLRLTPHQAQRVTQAFGRYWNLKDAQDNPREATAAEVKQFLVRQLAGVVRNQERAEAEARIPASTDLVVT